MSGAACRAGEDVRISFEKTREKTLMPRTNIGNSEPHLDELGHHPRSGRPRRRLERATSPPRSAYRHWTVLAGARHEHILWRELDRRAALKASTLEELDQRSVRTVERWVSPPRKSHRDDLQEFNVLFFP
jgi:hypothetical protein